MAEPVKEESVTAWNEHVLPDLVSEEVLRLQRALAARRPTARIHLATEKDRQILTGVMKEYDKHPFLGQQKRQQAIAAKMWINHIAEAWAYSKLQGNHDEQRNEQHDEQHSEHQPAASSTTPLPEDPIEASH